MELCLKILLLFLITIGSGKAQVLSVEALPEIINKIGTSNRSASFNKEMNRLCFYREHKTLANKIEERYIMVSDKLPSGEWSEPYVVIPLPNKGLLQGLNLNSSGNKIFASWNEDITVIENLGGKQWSLMLKVPLPVSSAQAELSPAISDNGQLLTFLKRIQDKNKSSWIETPFYSKRQVDGQWSNPNQFLLTKSIEHAEEFVMLPDAQIAFYATATQTTNQNWYIQFKDSVFSLPTEIDFSAGRITWMNSDLTIALASAFTFNNSKIVEVRFHNGWNSNQVKLTSQGPITRDLKIDSSETSTIVKPTGKYYGLIIGVSNYLNDNLDLDNPVRDATYLKEILISQYQFESNNTTLLLNPTRQQILKQLIRLRSIVTPNDNVLIFYAGHGHWDNSVEQGYWWPNDASPQDPTNWLSNSDLREQIRGIKSGHTLLISDACFSGGIFKVRSADELRRASLSIQQLYKTKSRRAITSGNLSSVPDESVFFKYLMERLISNTDKFLPAQTLYNSFKIAVMNNSGHPLEGVINDAGDEGGDFIFIRKN